MHPWSTEIAGCFVHHTFASTVLQGNVLGDPTERPLMVYLPPGYDVETERRYPTIYVLQGMTGQLDMWWNRTAFRPTTPERIDALFASPGVPPALVVFVDA